VHCRGGILLEHRYEEHLQCIEIWFLSLGAIQLSIA
jgi:hypothetical protein